MNKSESQHRLRPSAASSAQVPKLKFLSNSHIRVATIDVRDHVAWGAIIMATHSGHARVATDISPRKEDTPAEPTLEEARAWFSDQGLLRGDKNEAAVRQIHKALSKCNFGDRVNNGAKQRFVQPLVLCEHNLAGKQIDIGNMSNSKCPY